jgi:hypothetical protein
MKYNGKLLVPNVADLYLPRMEDGVEKVIHVRATAVLNYDKFHALIPVPKPPMKIVRGGKKEPDFEHPNFLSQIDDYGKLKTHWMMIESLKPTVEFEWEKIDPANPQTWEKWEEELMEAGFSEFERQRIQTVVMEANALSEKRLEDARERFLKGLVASALNCSNLALIKVDIRRP